MPEELQHVSGLCGMCEPFFELEALLWLDGCAYMGLHTLASKVAKIMAQKAFLLGSRASILATLEVQGEGDPSTMKLDN